MMCDETITEQLRNIKRSLRGVMNGPVSASMREKGLTYKVNFGVELPRLQAWAALALALWKEDIRECRLLAGMLMPVEAFGDDLAEVWVEQMHFVEEAECTVMHLFARAPWASDKAFQWIASPHAMHELCGYLLLARLFMQGREPGLRDLDEFLDQAATALRSDNLPVARAAYKALLKLADLGPVQEAAADKVLSAL